MMTIKRFGVFSVACISAILYSATGLIFGFLYAFTFSIAFAVAGTMSTEFTGFGALGIGVIWILAIIGIPIIYGILGFVFGIIGSALYNVFSKWIGGIKVELAQDVLFEL